MHPPQVMGTPNAVFDVFDAHADAQYVSLNVPCTGLFAVKAALTLHDLVHLPPPPFLPTVAPTHVPTVHSLC
jgi:hypothetical protein